MFGVLIGRVANRIAGGRFEVDGQAYQVPINNGPNALHGGTIGFDQAGVAHHRKRIRRRRRHSEALALEYVSPDGEQGFPGTVTTRVVYRLLTAENTLIIEYLATTDRATPINLTNHAYFNLPQQGNGTVLDHVVEIDATHYTPVDETLIPTGDINPVADTPMDFNTEVHRIGERIDLVPGGYDHNYVLDADANVNGVPAAHLQEPDSGRVLEVFTTQPGVQFYTGNFLDGNVRGIGGAYVKHGGFCLETQHFPDAVNRPNFPGTILRPGETYRQASEYRFAVMK